MTKKTVRQMLEILIDTYKIKPVDVSVKTRIPTWSVMRWYKGKVANPFPPYAEAIEKFYDREVAKRTTEKADG